MPSLRPSSQPEELTRGWLGRGAAQQMLADVQRAAIPELTRVFGHHGLYMRPSRSLPASLSGNMLGHVVGLHRQAGALAGELRCTDADLPITTSSLSLVYALFMLESSPQPGALLQEIARTLTPEGTALIISLNPWSIARARWLLKSDAGAVNVPVARLAEDAGLELVRKQNLGPVWPRANQPSDPGSSRWLEGFRAASLVVLRRRVAALTPLRNPSAAVSLRPGMSTG